MAVPPPVRLVLTSLAVSFAAIPGMLLWSATVLALSLFTLTLGFPLSLTAFRAVRWYADRYRGWVGAFTGDPVPRPYRVVRATGWLPRFRAVAGDPATWRDVAWLPFNATVGFTIALLPVAFVLNVLWHLTLPVVFLAGGALSLNYGVFTIHDLPTSFLGLLPAAAAVVAFAIAGRPLLALHARLTRWFLGPTARTVLDRRVTELTESRAETLDTQAAELRRIERDLHDGAQARLVALGMSLGMAEKLISRDPAAAAALLAEAARTNATALAELRDLARGIHPPVLADRGLAGAVQALALSSAIPVRTTVDLPGRLPAPVESALYFAVAEAVANLGKHSAATTAWLTLTQRDGAAVVVVGDDGRGGAVDTEGGGLHGIRRRLAAFDGTMTISSPPGGPTTVTMEVPCASSSERT
jgi:signal transduction histidine kinase